MRLYREFFAQHTVDVAQKLLGKSLIYGPYKGVITETEAYRGQDDAASHAHRGPTKRSKIMFGLPGIVYVYMIYGIYYCLNIVTEQECVPGAVLIRGLLLPDYCLNGPGKLCRHLGITTAQNGVDITLGSDLYIESTDEVVDFKSTERIGIKKATDKLWRFVLVN